MTRRWNLVFVGTLRFPIPLEYALQEFSAPLIGISTTFLKIESERTLAVNELHLFFAKPQLIFPSWQHSQQQILQK